MPIFFRLCFLDKYPKGEWPKQGMIQFIDLSMKYDAEDPQVLNKLNFTILPGQKIGIVGRTGAGKSSLLSALFHLSPIEGSIYIDGVDTQELGLTDLRKKISIIPQEPVLFSATLRYNLDPFNEFTDEQLWKVIEQVELKKSIESLDFKVSEGGGNFSLGQRQLICLALAALRNNKILVLDEATANVDPRWMVGIIRKGTKKCLGITDLYKPLNKDESNRLAERFEKHWKNEIVKRKSGKPSLFKALAKTFWLEFFVFGFFWFILNVVLWCSQPVILGKLISLFRGPKTPEKQLQMYCFGTILVTISGSIIFSFHHLCFGLSALGMRLRIALSASVYRKIMKLSQKSLGKTPSGQIVNLLSNDVNRFDQVLFPLHALWAMPCQVTLLTFIIWQQVGISSLAGIISMAIVALPVQGYLAKVMGDYRAKISKKTDARVKLMNEIVSGIQVIKMYAWEKPFEEMIKNSRRTEIRDITTSSYIRGVFSSCIVFLERLALGFTVICFVLLGNKITSETVFSLAQAYNVLQLAMAVWYPMAISLGAEALISIKRLQEFLLLEEKEEVNLINENQPGIQITSVNASWITSGTTLKNINLHVPTGILCAVVGPVGSGKSSLLQLLLGELVASSGQIQIGGKVSYSSQNPWLFQSTVRNNILFGLPYDKFLYKQIVRVCALTQDFEQFPQGDQTIVGERGVSLSGGQRARINLARAVYRKADIYLLDDPLSAVDTHVGKQLFDECVKKYLSEKTRILVTHQLQYLKRADWIVVIDDGKIEAQGTFEQLLEKNIDFTKLLVAEEEEEEEHATKIESSLNKYEKSDRRASMKSVALSEVSEIIDECSSQNEETGNDPNSKPFKDYLTAPNKLFVTIITFTIVVLAQLVCAGADYWVAFWTAQEEIRQASNTTIYHSMPEESIDIYSLNQSASMNLSGHYYYTTNTTVTHSFNINDLFDYILIDNEQHKLLKTNYAIYFYVFIIGLAVLLTIGRSFLFFKMCMMSSVNLHTKIFHNLLKAPMRFFDTNPSGRVLNRFSKDMGAIDEMLPKVLMDSITIFLVMCGILINVSLSNVYMIIAIVILGAVFLKLRAWYLDSAKVLKHLEGITKSPVFSHVNSTLHGLTTIRASGTQDTLIKEFDNHQDVHTSAWYFLIACMSTFGLWLDLICLIFTITVTFSFIILYQYYPIDGSLVGLAISQALILTGMLQHGMRQTAEVINQLTSVERILQYTTIQQEGPFQTPKDKYPKGEWPKQGMIQFIDISMKYVADDPPVLNKLNFTISPGQKIGIVGRTGAGKSSLLSALFHLSPLEGSIYIDGVDTQELGLTDLRKKISIIPQEPVLFSATLRYNLDPFNEFTDEQLWKVIEQVELKNSIESLDFKVSEGGGNFSLGQRQLICLARAALRNNKILVLDEATANVDPRTDSFIQSTIRKRFKDCTVLTIAHRLNTIMDSDKVLVMSFGNLVEMGHPHELLQIPDGHFHSLVLETGPLMTMQLKQIASEAHSKVKFELNRVD